MWFKGYTQEEAIRAWGARYEMEKQFATSAAEEHNIMMTRLPYPTGSGSTEPEAPTFAKLIDWQQAYTHGVEMQETSAKNGLCKQKNIPKICWVKSGRSTWPLKINRPIAYAKL